MVELYTDSHFPLLEKWVTDADLLLQFSGTEFTYPITRKQVSDYQSKHPDRNFYLGYTKDKSPFAFGEIIPQESGSPRIARVLVGDPSLRGHGLGKYFIKLLLNECKRLFECQGAELFVWDKNYAAIRCYQGAGFKYATEERRILVYENKSYNLHKMIFTF